MAFSGAHFEFGYQKKVLANASPILGIVTSAETMASAGTTSASAPAADVQGDPCVNIIVSADTWVTFGSVPADPSSTTSPRRLVFALSPLPCFVNPGDKVRWALA